MQLNIHEWHGNHRENHVNSSGCCPVISIQKWKGKQPQLWHRLDLIVNRSSQLNVCNYLGQFIYDDERTELQITIQFIKMDRHSKKKAMKKYSDKLRNLFIKWVLLNWVSADCQFGSICKCSHENYFWRPSQLSRCSGE